MDDGHASQFLHSNYRLRFALQSENHVLGLPVGKHILLSATINGKFCMRAYTPTSNDDDVGYFELLIKIYFKNADSKFPVGGLFSQVLDSLKIGETVDVKGPIGHIIYEGKGHFLVNNKPKFARKIGMLAGIAPFQQKSITREPKNCIYSDFVGRESAITRDNYEV